MTDVKGCGLHGRVWLTWEGIGKAILELVGIIICVCELSHIDTELTKTLQREVTKKRSTFIKNTERKSRQTDKSPHVELLLVARLSIRIHFFQLRHPLGQSLCGHLGVS